jgi:hypothetical protein
LYNACSEGRAAGRDCERELEFQHAS